MQRNILIEKISLYVGEVLPLTRAWKYSNREFEIATQCFRSTTSVQANIEEANAAEGRKDFIHKLSISRKELRESIFWLRVAEQQGLISGERNKEIISIATEVFKLLNASISTARNNLVNIQQ